MLKSRYEDLDCRACGSLARHRYLFSKWGCDIYRCEACGLGRTDAAAFDPAAYYNGGYFSGGHADGYADYQATEPVLRREFAREVNFIRRFCPAGRLLEIGCAYGFFLQEAKPHFEVVGIEISEDAAAHCRNLGLDVYAGAATRERLEELGTFDIIVMLDVIEHLPDPHATLSACVRHLRPGGIVVLTTGDFGSPVARWAGVRWRLMTPPQHLWFFTVESMRRLARRLSLQILSVDHPWKIVPLSLIGFQLARLAGRRLVAPAAGARIGVPVNLFDAMRVVLRCGDSP